ncbi:pyruvate, phosphate dikinase [Streptomyces goshikiensis]|nr:MULTISPECIES: PEP/pyruvate-binding domain-containing protein [Streptomyces]AKL69526.1 pyruvate phosphate dikinase [Streptomyces sp. Mg1]RPK32144.1 Pyruvate, phosphate dikinase [Streptomyces sp. ADI91-18]WBY18275.1 pyruvate, phosphate dikinase [Streptomyces goshikiensis]WSS02820.1 pyruvate, phosphate dikinase [Streptomyces goshikiensis]
MGGYVYDFNEGGRDMAELLGSKGANLAEITSMGLPVPPGFTITAEACRVFLATGEPPEGLDREVSEHLATLERAAGKRLGQVDDPLLLSVRAGAEAGRSVPGTMETILDIGLNDLSVLGLARMPDRDRFGWDSYRRLVQMFGSTVMGVESSMFEDVLRRIKAQHRVADASQLDTCDLIRVVETFKDLILERTGRAFPQDPAEQLRQAVLTAFQSGTAVTVQSMVFGNCGADSGSGVVFGRDPATGRPGLYGNYLPNAQGEDVVSGGPGTLPLQELAALDPASRDRLFRYMEQLEEHYRDVCDIEFTIEHGTLWLLETHVGQHLTEEDASGGPSARSTARRPGSSRPATTGAPSSHGRDREPTGPLGGTDRPMRDRGPWAQPGGDPFPRSNERPHS